MHVICLPLPSHESSVLLLLFHIVQVVNLMERNCTNNKSVCSYSLYNFEKYEETRNNGNQIWLVEKSNAKCLWWYAAERLSMTQLGRCYFTKLRAYITRVSIAAYIICIYSYASRYSLCNIYKFTWAGALTSQVFHIAFVLTLLPYNTIQILNQLNMTVHFSTNFISNI